MVGSMALKFTEHLLKMGCARFFVLCLMLSLLSQCLLTDVLISQGCVRLVMARLKGCCVSAVVVEVTVDIKTLCGL